MRQLIFLLTLLTFLTLETKGQDDREIFIDPEQIAKFPGGNDSLMSFLNKNLIKPTKNEKKGKVFVSFFVNVDGTLTDFRIEKGLTNEYNMRALEVVKKMPKWTPGTMYGTPVRQRYVLPIKFE